MKPNVPCENAKGEGSAESYVLFLTAHFGLFYLKQYSQLLEVVLSSMLKWNKEKYLRNS